MSWSGFDNSQQGAGGFMDGSVNEGNNAGDEKAGPKRGQNCIPVMIGQLLRHGEKIALWGTPARIVTFVGIVRSLEALSTKVTFEFEDETGSIKGIKWLEAENEANFESPVSVGCYARVYGLVRDQADGCYVLIVNVQPLEHVNELFTHIMEVTLACLQAERATGQPQGTKTEAVLSSQGQTNGSSSATLGGLTYQQQLVLDIIKKSESEYGAERDDIKKRVPANVVSKVDEIIEFLSGEGHIYTTKTDDFFKAI